MGPNNNHSKVLVAKANCVSLGHKIIFNRWLVTEEILND